MFFDRNLGGVILDNRSIGIFDSGLGGISVLYEIHRLMPNESLVYYGDSKNAPYGIKSKEAVLALSKIICDDFIKRDVKAIVIACNTATSAAIKDLRSIYNIPIIGMEPAIKPAIEATKAAIVVMATEMTLKEKKFKNLVASFEDKHRIIKVPAPKLVTLVESGRLNEAEIKSMLSYYLKDIDENVEGIVLGCTHFIFLKPYIDDYYNGKIAIFDGNIGTAIHLQNILKENHQLTDGRFEGEITIKSSQENGFEKLAHKLLQSLVERE